MASSHKPITGSSSRAGTVLGWPPVPRSCCTALRTAPPPGAAGSDKQPQGRGDEQERFR